MPLSAIIRRSWASYTALGFDLILVVLLLYLYLPCRLNVLPQPPLVYVCVLTARLAPLLPARPQTSYIEIVARTRTPVAKSRI